MPKRMAIDLFVNGVFDVNRLLQRFSDYGLVEVMAANDPGDRMLSNSTLGLYSVDARYHANRKK